MSPHTFEWDDGACMTTRDPRSRDPAHPDKGAQRDPTQSLSLDADDIVSDPSHPSLALGTHEAQERDERTRIESPGARGKTPAPPSVRAGATKPPPVPKGDDPDNRIGETLGNYKVAELLGKGGMGFVYRAEHIKLGREVALKLLRSDYAKRKDAVARFIQEARTVNRIRHRNIVDVPDILELEDGTTCIVMEFLRGQSLGKWARTGIDLPRALAVLVQICDGLAAAHAVNIVHRDLKPDNVIVVPTSDGAELVKLLDFGVAKLLNRDDEDIGFQTAAGSVIGTPAYMSPEQAGGMAIDGRSDIYSLGAIMYELFCGQPMFRGRSFGEYVRKHLTEMPVRPRLTQGGAHMDDRIEAVILKALEKDPNLRFQHVLELRDALLHLLGAMETHPPGFAVITSSGIRPPPLPPMPAMPLPHVTTPPSGGHPSVQSGPYAAMHPSSAYSPPSYNSTGYGVIGLTPPPPLPATPWFVWFIGGAIAVSLGVGAAVWYAGGDELPDAPVAAKQPGTALTVTPAAPEPSVPVVKQVGLRFDSLPSGGVFADGKSAELCQTPCTHNVDMQDGGSTLRTFFVKSDGHRDGVIVVDLTQAKREFSVTLERYEPVVVPPQPTIVTNPPSTKSTKSTKSSNKPKSSSKSDKQVTNTPPPQPEPDVEDVSDKKADKRSGDKIDRSDTLDPFRCKRP
ncbi:MAG: serine/threonine protein kinase [Deltaproteobacteria bacterium]|nr:serine/threonine protein kinase [Deltaproteobacteria bacterium]